MGMIKIKNTFVSDVKPQIQDGLWLKVIDGGVALYLIENGSEKPLKVVEDTGTAISVDDIVADTASKVKSDLVGKDTDTKTSDTINGAKKYAEDQASAILGTAEDESTDMTLYGLKAYVDSQIEALG
jgi:hypothetical protein